ncbi:hypothetical protein [Aquimarina longa]|uniref:hypothetical protein n=1 Tax=Aquimarina longa TaxID=1080221 RepID=UPI000783A3D9|nr:hypothetical protein [Aquimarina longa]
MKYTKKQVIALYMLSAYSNNLLDLIDTIESEMKIIFRHDIKRACTSFYKSIDNNKMLNNLLDEMFKVDSLEYNEYRDEVDKTVLAVLENSPNKFVRLQYARKFIESNTAILFTEKEMKEFAMLHKTSKFHNVSNNLDIYIDTNNKFKKVKKAIKNSLIC